MATSNGDYFLLSRLRGNVPTIQCMTYYEYIAQKQCDFLNEKIDDIFNHRLKPKHTLWWLLICECCYSLTLVVKLTRAVGYKNRTADIKMTKSTKIILTLLLGVSALSCQKQIQNKTNDSIDILTNIDTIKVSAVQLPRPNSGTFSFEEAEKRKDEIYDMQLSVKHFDWKNPTSGGALHINHNDEIEVYQFTMGMMFLGKDLDKKGDSAVYVNQAPKDTVFVIKKGDIKHHVGGVGQGNPASVLITSEYDLKKSKSIELILEEVFEPATQIYYLKKKWKY